jgi:uncharacterized protein YciU (UPF0263 family)
MTLDPVHFDGITRLAGQLGGDVDESDHRDLAATAWAEFLDPLYGDDGEAVLEPLGDKRRRSAEIEAVALSEPPFPTTHGLDSGTINPTTFKNGLVLDVAQAAMSACPSDLELHRGRTIIMTAHTNDTTRDLDADWRLGDEGYSRLRRVHAPRVSRYAEGVVHALSLYLAESQHALDNAGVVEDLLYLDGPLYPKGMLNWLDRDPELAELLVDEDQAREAVANYVDLVETFVREGTPLVGFVKNPSSKSITRTLRRRTEAPWVDDAAFFRQVLERLEPTDDPEAGPERRTDQLTFTNWFVSRGGADRVMSTAGDRLDVDLDLDPEAYEVAFCVLYDPRDDVVYKLEAPMGLVDDDDRRTAVTRQVLSEVAAERGPPLAIHKADELARISRDEKESLRQALEREFQSERDRTYDDLRWLDEE